MYLRLCIFLFVVFVNASSISVEPISGIADAKSINCIQPNTKSKKIIFDKYYVLAQNAVPSNIIVELADAKEHCNDKLHKENRYFGVSNYKNVSGHTVTFIDDCMPDNAYKFFKNIVFEMLAFIKHTIIDTAYDQSSKKQRVQDEDELFYDWEELVSMAPNLESRVIEYVVYTPGGHIGWHVDDDSNFTIVAMLNSEDEFLGGVSLFGEEAFDEDVYEIRLHANDIIMFPSLTDHAITPVINGTRIVLVIEYWNIGRSFEPGRVLPSEHLGYEDDDEMENPDLYV